MYRGSAAGCARPPPEKSGNSSSAPGTRLGQISTLWAELRPSSSLCATRTDPVALRFFPTTTVVHMASETRLRSEEGVEDVQVSGDTLRQRRRGLAVQSDLRRDHRTAGALPGEQLVDGAVLGVEDDPADQPFAEPRDALLDERHGARLETPVDTLGGRV